MTPTERIDPVHRQRRSPLRHALGVVCVWVANHAVSRIPVHTLRLGYYRRVMGFRIDGRAMILTDVRFARRGNLTLGDGAVVNNGCRIDNRYPVAIGRSTSLSYATFVLTKGHDVEHPSFATRGAPVTIGENVWCTVRTTILPGVTIADRAVILPGSVVAHDVAEAHVVGGVPAETVRMRQVHPHDVPPYDGHNPVFG
jgi:acetyltransferase-like isoleucine patch superfamily enzyme